MDLGTVDASVKTLSITVPNPLRPLRVIEGGGMTHVLGHVSGETRDGLDDFFHSRSLTEKDGEAVELSVGGGLYSCQRREVNGAIGVKGVCLEGLQISVPVGSKTKVIVNGKFVRLVGPMSMDDLMTGLESQSFDDGKVEVVAQFAKSQKGALNFIYMSQVAEIFKKLSFDDAKVEVAELVSGGVIDRGNFGMLLELMSFDSNKEKIASALGI
jgi:hypothetical protein